MSFNQLKEFNENEKNQALQDFNDRLAENKNILEQNKEELKQRVSNLLEPVGTEVLRLSGERLLKKYGMKKYYDAIKSGDTNAFVKQATSDANNKIQQIVSDKADPYLKSLGLNDEQVSNFKNGEFDKLGDNITSNIFKKANDVEDNLDVRNALSNTGFKAPEIDAVMDTKAGDLLANKAYQFRQRLPSLMDKYSNGLNNQGQTEFGKLTNNQDPTIDNIGDHEAVMDALLKNPELREAQGLVGGGEFSTTSFSVPELAKQFNWKFGISETGGAEKDILTPEQREAFEKQEFAEDLARASRAGLPPPPERALPTDIDLTQQAIQPTKAELFRRQIEAGERTAPSKLNRGGTQLEARQDPISNPNVIDGSYSRGSYKIPSKQAQPKPVEDQPTGGAQSQIADQFPISDEDLAPIRAFRASNPPPPKPEQLQSTSGIQTAGQDISEGVGGLAAAKQGRSLFKKIKNRGSSKNEPPAEEEPQEPPAVEEAPAEDAETSIGDEAPPVESKPSEEAPPPQEEATAPTDEPKPVEGEEATETGELSEADKEAILAKGGTGEIGDATAENAGKLAEGGAGAIFEDAGLAEASSEGFLNPVMDGVGLITGIAGLLMGSGIFSKKPKAPSPPPPPQNVSVVSGSLGEGQI